MSRFSTKGTHASETDSLEQKNHLFRCLDIDKDLEHLIASSKQVYVTMPAKATGSTMKSLFSKCFGPFKDNFINNRSHKQEYFQSHLEIPSFIASHSYKSETLKSLIRHATNDSLLIYMYRNELDRLVSAINQVAERICNDPQSDGLVSLNGTKCVIDEKQLVHKYIIPKKYEIGTGNFRILTCETYGVIDEFRPPKLLFVHYKKADALQELLIKHHCPNKQVTPVAKNVLLLKDKEIYVHLNNTKLTEGHNYEVTLTDYLLKKRNTIAFLLDLYKDEGSCIAKTRSIENALMQCPHNVISI